MADEQSAVTFEAAASLFGSGDDVATDFFSTAFSDSKPEHTGSEEHSSSVSNSTSNLFEAGPDGSASSLFESASYDSYQSASGSSAVTKPLPVAVEPQVHSQTDYNSTAYQNQGWHDEYGQWHPYEGETQHASTYDYASKQQSSDPYAPPAGYYSPSYHITQQQNDYTVPPMASDQPNQLSFQHSYAPVQSRHQPTMPPMTSSQSNQQSYASEQASCQHTASLAPPVPLSPLYNPTVTAAQKNTYNQPPYNAYQSSKLQPNTNTSVGPSTVYDRAQEVVKQPVSDVATYRPTTLNAYDPPLLPKSRVKTRNTAITQSPIVPYYQQQESMPLQMVSPAPPAPASHFVKANSSDDYPWPGNDSRNYYGGRGSVEQPQDAQNETASATSQFSNARSAEDHVPYVHDIDSSSRLTENAPIQMTANQHRIHFAPESNNRKVDGYESIETSDTRDDHLGDDDITGMTATPNDVEQSDGRDHPSDGQTSTIEPHSSSSMASPPPLTGSPEGIAKSMQGIPVVDAFSVSSSPFDPYRPYDHKSSEQNDTLPSVPEKSWGVYAPSEVSVMSQDSYRPRSYTAATDHTRTYDPYAPKAAPQRTQSLQGMVLYNGEHTSPFSYPRGVDPQTTDAQSYTAPDIDSTANYATLISAPIYAPYAPSPSLLGTNDPLGRTSARVPVISFGFGGKLVSCFHSASDPISGFDVSLTARQSTIVLIRTLHEIIPASAMDSSGGSYPGPLFFDPGPSSISLARTVGVGVAGNVKAKKALLSKWLDERTDELSSGIPHIASGSQERYNAEGRQVLVRILKAMVQNDGQLSGSPSIEWAVRSALIPRFEAQSLPVSGGSSTELPITSSYGSALADSNEPPLAYYTLKSSVLDRIQEFLLRGERHKAYHYAVDEKLWAHAMLIASSIDTQAWKEVVKEFIHSELGVKQTLGSSAGPKPGATPPTVNGRESLRVAYSLFSGQGALAVQELIPSTAIVTNKETSLAPPVPGLHATPISPNFPQPALTASVPSEALEKWQETAAIMASGQTTGDSAALTALGDYLSANRWFDAAHACYLLSPRTSSFGGLGMPSVRTVLVGCESPATLRNFHKDLDVTIFSEIVEFALSLSPSKNQDAFAGLPHLQAYKLVRASYLAEMGHVEIANRYCEAIGSTIRASIRGSQFYTPTFVGELKNLSDRLTAAPQLDKTASWISRKMAKPSLDTIGSWLEGRFSKLIVGDGEDGTEASVNEPTQPSHQSYGPFSHYSAISSATSSAAPSRSSTPYGAGSLNPDGAAPLNTTTPIDRAASAMDHLRPERRRTSPVPRVASASAATTTFAQAYNPGSHYKPVLGAVNGTAEKDNTVESEGQEVTWWGSHSGDNAGPTPTATTFHGVDKSETEGNFISLMDDFSPGPTPMAPKSSQSRTEDEDLEDLGFSNTALKAKAESTTSDTEPSDKSTKEAKDEKKSEAVKPELKQQSTSWLGRWWPRASSTSTAPIKANLGEETTFYYDKELKRWVNKKAGAAPTAPTPPPPPPSRPRTASPAPVRLSAPPNGSSSTPPPPRAASAADVGGRKPPRIRSNLVPKEEATSPGSAPPLATSFNAAESSGPASGPPRTKSAAGKRNVRSRYVDILQQPSAS